MTDHDILNDDERAALSELMNDPELPPQRALIVDDDVDARELLADILILSGINCTTAGSAMDAMRLLREKKSIGVLITDLRMMPESGLDLIREVRSSERAALPIIIISGDAGVRDAIAAMHLSVVDFLLKPIDCERLIALVKHELGLA